MSRWEIAFLALSVPVWTGLALALWALELKDFGPLQARQLGTTPPWEFLPSELGFIWTCLALLAAVGITVSYLRWTTATPEESLLYLQDQCWRQTRQQQGLLNRWLTWARLRAQRKKEPS